MPVENQMRSLPSGLLIPEDVPGWNVRREFADRVAEIPELWISAGGRERALRKIAGGANQPYFQPVLPTMVTSQTAITGTAEAAAWPVNPYSTIPANVAFGGQMWLVWAAGIMTTAASTPGTLTLTPRYGTTTGGVSLGASAASATLGTSQTNVPWNAWGILTVRAISNTASSSTVVCGLTMTVPSGVLASSLAAGGTVATTADTTTAQGLFLGVTMGSASDTLTTQAVAFGSLN